MARSCEQRKKQNANNAQPLERFPYNQCGGGQARLNRELEGHNRPTMLANTQKEEEDSAIPSSQTQAVMDHGHSPKGEEVVMDTSQVVVGTSQKSKEAVGCQPIRP